MCPLLLLTQMGLFHQLRLSDERLKRRRNDNLEGRAEVLGEKSVPVPNCLPQIPAALVFNTGLRSKKPITNNLCYALRYLMNLRVP